MRPIEDFPNLVQLFFARAGERGDRPFLWRKTGGAWHPTSWREAARQVAALALSLRRVGLEPGDRVMLVAENRPEWCIADLAIMAAGCVTVPTYTTNTERDHLHILENSGARGVIVSTDRLARALLPAVMRAPAADIVIGIDPLRFGQSGAVDFHAFADLVAGDPDVSAIATDATATRDDLACIIYTSGTGGAPRGVMQHHGAIMHNTQGCRDVIDEDFGSGDEVFLSFLPLSHAYEHTGGQFFPIGVGAEIYYAESLEKLAGNIEEVKPTIMVVVPRLFEVLRQRIVKAVEKQGGLGPKLMARAVALGERELSGGLKLWDRPLDLILDLTIRRKVQQRFGGRIKALVSGGAPLNPEVGAFFHGLGLTLLQGYGQTEAAPVISCNRPKAGLKMSTVGPPLPRTEVRIAEDGEILVRGALVMKGYWHNDAETARVLRDGWLHTGDIGHIDEAGRIEITDRKKDLIVNDKGENVAPQRIEGMLTLQPEIFQAMVAGDKRPYLVGLIVPDPEWTAEWREAAGVAADGDVESDPAYRAAVAAAVDRVNRDLSTTEKVRRFVIADAAFTVENEMLTPSMKIRRHVIRGEYGARLDALYRGEQSNPRPLRGEG